MQMEKTVDEDKCLRACVNDLIPVLALPPNWIGAEPQQIVTALLDVLLATLGLDLAYAVWRDPPSGPPIKTARFAQPGNDVPLPSDIGQVFDLWLEDHKYTSPFVARNFAGDGDLSIAAFRLGLKGEQGWLVAGSRCVDFPTEAERLLLNVAANQAAVGLQAARLLSEQRRIAKEVQQQVTELTRELQELKDRLQRENFALREQVDEASMFEEIVGTSPALRAVLFRVAKVAPTDSTVLILGETGTGKELIARAIHKRSGRSARAFVKVNCAATPPSLIASELFGHEKGAFTGALQKRMGRFELAHRGTLFLDEVGELPAETQITLLRVLQESEFERVGGTQVIRADVRVIAATNRDLNSALHNGVFRNDLFYRLNVFPIEMPPLRARKEDIPTLTEYFIYRYAAKLGKKISGISKETLDLFQSYTWPGNIRELQNVIERSLIVCDTETFLVDQSWLAQRPLEAGVSTRRLVKKISSDPKELIELALSEARGRVSGPLGAAVKLGIPASTLESKIRSLKINKRLFKVV
jgi:transcriptional regulator with GAF, ATPase, and Fis domain